MRSHEIMPPTNARYADQPWADAACAQEYQAQRAAWSASPNANNSDNAWNVNFNNGNDNNDNKSNGLSVRLVRSGQCKAAVNGREISLRELHAAWQRARKRKKPSHNQLAFEARWIEGLLQLEQALLTRTWRPMPPVCFITTRPKAREIHAPDFADRVVHHWLVLRLERVFEPRFIHDSFSNRAGKGTHAAVARLQQFMRRLRDGAGGGQAHYLQLDIANFFNCIDRGRLLICLEQHLKSCRDPQRDLMLFLCQQLLQGEPAAQVQWRASPKERAQVPPHKRLANSASGCGLPIGNLSSQFFANVVLDALDQFAKHQLKCKSYVRYVDDFVLLHEDAAQLEIWCKRIAQFLQEQLGLQLKAQIKRGSCDSGVDFLGYVVHPHYLTVRPRVVQHAHEKLTMLRSERLRRNFNTELLRSTVASYWGHFSHASAHRLRQRLVAQHPWLHTCFKNPHQPHPTFRRQSS